MISLTSRHAIPRRRYCGSVNTFTIVPLPAFGNCRCIERARQDRLQLNAGAANDRSRFISRSCEPADVVAALEPFLQPETRFRSQNSEGVIGNVAHILKHPRTMPGDNVDILQCGATDSKDVVHGSKRSIPIPPSQDSSAAGAQRPALNKDALVERAGETVAPFVETDTMP